MPDPEKKPADDGAGTGTEPEGNKPPTPPETPKKLDITQEELDRIIADRVRRAKPDDYDDLLKMKAERDAEVEAKKTEEQRKEDERKERERKTNEKNSKANAKLIRAEVIAEALAQNVIDADIVVALLSGSKDIKVDDDGEVTGAKEAVAQLLTDKPMLIKGSKSSSAGGEFGGNDPKTTVAKIAELEQRMNDPKLTLSERQEAGREARAIKMATLA